MQRSSNRLGYKKPRAKRVVIACRHFGCIITDWLCKWFNNDETLRRVNDEWKDVWLPLQCYWLPLAGVKMIYLLLKGYRQLLLTSKVKPFFACYSTHELMLWIYQHVFVNMTTGTIQFVFIGCLVKYDLVNLKNIYVGFNWIMWTRNIYCLTRRKGDRWWFQCAPTARYPCSYACMAVSRTS